MTMKPGDLAFCIFDNVVVSAMILRIPDEFCSPKFYIVLYKDQKVLRTRVFETEVECQVYYNL